MTTTWTMSIDWNRDGTYTDETGNVLSAQWTIGFHQPYMDVGNDAQLLLTMRNTDKRFTPEYTQGALYGNLVPLRPVIIESDDGVIKRRHYTGWIQTIQPSVNQYGERVAKIMVSGAMQFLKATETKIELQENQRTDQIIDTLTKEVIFPPALTEALVLGDENYGRLDAKLASTTDFSNLEEGLLTLNMAGDNWVRQGGYSDQTKDSFDVYRGIRDITAAERGKFYFDRDGKAVFWNRHHILDESTPTVTFNDTMTDMSYTYASLDQTKNEIIVTCHPRTIDEFTSTLWELSNAVIRVAPGETRDIYIAYKDENETRVGAKDVTVEGIEYIKGSATVTVEAKANGATLIFTNDSTTKEAIIEACVVKGRKILNSGQMEARSKDQVSITNYGRRVMNINLPSIDNLDQAQYIADFERNRRKAPFGLTQTITVQSHAENGGGQHEHQLALTIGDIITVTETQTAHSDTYIIIGEAHELAKGGRHWITTWYLEPQVDTLPWKIGTDSRNQIGQTTTLAY